MKEIDYPGQEILEMFERYKKLDQWSLNEGLFVPKMPCKAFYGDSQLYDNLEKRPDIPYGIDEISIFQAGIEKGDLKVEGYSSRRVESCKLSKPSATEFWYECFGGLKVSPFEFLGFVRKINLFRIPVELDHVKFISSTGDTVYCWTPTNIDELQTLENKHEVDFHPRDLKVERAVWDRWVQPVIDKYYGGGIEFQYYDKPERISQLGIEVVKRYASRKIQRIPRPLLQEDDFLREVLDRLRAGFTISRGKRVNLVNLFYDFMVELGNKGLLPLFLAYMKQEREGEFQEISDLQEVPGKPTVLPIVYKSKDPQEMLEELIQKIIPDIDLFYTQLCKVKDSKAPDAERDHPSFAMEAFQKHQKQFSYLSVDDLTYSFKENMSEEKYERVKGVLAQNMILRLDPALYMSAINSKDPSLNIVKNAQQLLKKINSIKRKLNII